MNLHEEYLLRHNVKRRAIYFYKSSCVFLRNKKHPNSYRILTLSWRNAENNHGCFEVTYFATIHNGCQDNVLTHMIKNEDWQWDQYESKLLEFVKEIRPEYEAIEDNQNLLLSWVSFLKVCDSWLAENMNHTFFDLVAESIDSALSYHKREDACRKAQSKLVANSYADNVWKFMMQPLSKTRSKWLVDLINS